MPNFFIVGAPKCGTTALYSYLRQHPQIFMPHRKEPRFFATDLDSGAARESRYFVRDLEEYRALFAPAGNARRVGEASALYLYSREAAPSIRRHCPEAKIIIMLRDPVELMYAFHSERLYNGNEEIADFGEALAAEADRRAGRRIPRHALIPAALHYREIATLSVQIERYLEHFPRENVCFILLDDFKRDVAGVYRQVLRFLEVDEGFMPEFRVVNSNKHIRFPLLRDLMRHPPALLRRVVHALLPARWRSRLRAALRRLNVKHTPRPAMDPGLRRRLQAEFAPEVARLGALVGRDLSSWSRT